MGLAYRNRKRRWRNGAGIVLFAIACFAYFQFFYPYHLFFKEQIQLFLYTASYLFSYGEKPAALACLAGDFLTQFYYLRGGGACVLTGVLLLEWWIVYRALRAFGAPAGSGLYALFPVVMEWGLQGQVAYSLSGVFSLIIGVAFFWGFVRLRRFLPAAVLLGILLLLVYLLAGMGMIGFLLLGIGYEWRQKGRKGWKWMFFLPLGLSIPLLLRPFYLLTVQQAYFYPVNGWLELGPVVLVLVAAARLSIGKSPTGRKRKMERVVLAVLLAGVWMSVTYRCADFSREKILSLDSEWYFGRPDRVLALAEAYRLRTPVAAYYTNLALSEKGELPDRLLQFYQPGVYGLFLPVGPATGWLTIFFSGEAFFQVGDLNLAQHSAMLGMIFSPYRRSSRLVKRLAEIHLIAGETAAARKYLHLLEKTLFHRRWAQTREAMLPEEGGELSFRLKTKRERLAGRDTLRRADDYKESLRILAESNPANREASDYLLCYHLLEKDIASFRASFDLYEKGKKTVPSRLYQEALLIGLAASDASAAEVADYRIAGPVIRDFREYTRLYQENEGHRLPLEKDFVSSYWFYYHFATLKNE